VTAHVYLPGSAQDDGDADLVRRCQAGDLTAFETLVARHQQVFFKVALRMLGNREEAADATQNVFLKLFEHLADYDPSHRFFSWAYRILVNECLNVQRQRRPEEPIVLEMAAVDRPFQTLEAGERRKAIQSALLALPVEQRAVVVLRHFAEMSYEEMSQTLGIPAKTVKSRLHAARTRLMDLLISCRV
jgi:RNA polymerase sigma-70 factor, ECF subfamily